MQDVKIIIGVVAVLLTFVGYIPYLRDTIKTKTKPHIYSWFIWGFITIIAFALQTGGGAGVGALVTLAAAIVCFVIFFLGLRNGDKDITTMDTIFFIAALVAIGIWLFVKQPLISVVLVSVIDVLGFIPTIRKSWHRPNSETLFTYLLNTFRHGLSILALQRYTIITSLYPIVWTIANGLFSLMLVVRRKQM